MSDDHRDADLQAAEELRARAEARLEREGAPSSPDPGALPPDEVRRTIQDLRVHQIELEIQNEELIRAQEALSDARARYFDLFDLAPVGYLTLGDDGRIQEANLTAANFLRRDRGSLVAEPFTRFIAASDQDVWYHARRRLRSTSQPQSLGLEMRRADGTTFHGELDVTVAHDDPAEPAVRIAVSDASERKRLESERQRLEHRLQQAEKSESLGRMAAAMAHHFNNRLGAIIGNLELVLRELPEDSGPAGALTDAIAAAHEAGARSRLLLTYLGQAEGEPAVRDLSEICRDALPALTAAMHPGLRLQAELPSPGPHVSVIPGQIELVLTNLVANACEAAGAGPDGRVVRLSVQTVGRDDIPTEGRFPVRWTPRRESYACLSVTDPGEGVEPWLVERVFDPFFTTKAFGRGLGLPVALGATRAHGGAIVLRSDAQAGSTLEVYLPLSPDAVPERGGVEERAPAPAGEGTVLVVDDEPLMRRMASRLLEHLGYEVIAAAGGSEAVALFEEQRERVSWVLCDLTMPGMNGWETMAAMRETSPGVHVVLTSGFDEGHALAARGSVEPPTAFLAKPWTLRDLVEVLPDRGKPRHAERGSPD